MSEEPQIPRRYVNIRRKGSKAWRTVRAQVWDGIPGRDGEVWLKEVRPVVRLSGEEDRNVYSLIGSVHAALSEVGLRRRANRFITQAYYLGGYDEVLRLATEFVEFAEPESRESTLPRGRQPG
jgi:hypothetical protein